MKIIHIKCLITIFLCIFSFHNSFAGIYEYTFTGQTFDKNHTTNILKDLKWTISVDEKNNVSTLRYGYSSTNGQKFSNNTNDTPLKLTLSANIPYPITSISIITSAGKTNNIETSIQVGESIFKCNSQSSYPLSTQPKEYKFIGIGKGKIAINWKQKKEGYEFYIKKIKIEYEGDLNKESQNLQFPQKEYTAYLGKEFIAPQVTGAKTTVTYTSSNKDIADIDMSTGAITLKNTGTTTITATAVGNETYKEAKASYVLSVKREGIYTTTFNFEDYNSFGLHFESNYIFISSIHSEDIVLSSGQDNYFHKSSNGNLIRFKVLKDNSITFSAPKGMKIESICFEGEDVKYLESNIKQDTDGKLFVNASDVTFSAKSVVSLKKAIITYSGIYEISISPIGYSTFSTAQAYTMPEGLSGGIVTVSGNTANVAFCYQPGDIVPAKEALILKGAQGNYPLRPTSTTIPKKKENQLKAALVSGTIKTDDKHKLLIFSLSKKGVLGFYFQQGCPDGSYLQDIPNKAYLEMPISTLEDAQHGLKLNILPTGITFPDFSPSETKIYNLSGREVNHPLPTLPKGIYIINGKKTIIK